MNLKYSIALGLIFFLLFAVQISTHKKTTYHPEFHDEGIWSNLELGSVYAYPPGVGILSNAKDCLSCHVNNGPWADDANTIVDILDAGTKLSLKQPDGSFLIETKRWEAKTVLTVIGSVKCEQIPAPAKNAWLYIDTATIGNQSLSKFAPNWEVNLPMSCRIVGDKLPGYEGAHITSLPMTIRPMTEAKNGTISLQVMLTSGEAEKANAKEGMVGSYFERKVKLIVK